MRPWATRLMMSLFFLGLAGYLVWSAAHRPRVFVLQSYSTDYSWTRNVDSAIRKVLDGKPYDVRYHYMDTKRHPDQDFKRVAGSLARNRINEWSPDVLIAVDDNAQSLVAVCYADPAGVDRSRLRGLTDADSRALFGACHGQHPDIKLVFAGIGARPEDYGYRDQANVTGITERIDVAQMLELLRILAGRRQPPALRVVAPVDDSTSGTYNRDSLQRLKTMAKPYGITVDIRRIPTFPQWRALVEQTNVDADLLLFSNYHTLKCSDSPTAARVPPRELIKWTQANSLIPGIGAWGFYVEDGGMLALGVSPFEQGERAARLVVEILDQGVEPGRLEVETTHQSLVYMREPLMRYYRLELPRIYGAFARAIDKFHPCRDRRGDCRQDIRRIEEVKRERSLQPGLCGGGNARGD